MPESKHSPLLAASYRQETAENLLQQADEMLLALFEFGQPAPANISDPRHVQVALKPLQSGPVCEIWQTRGPVVSGQWQDIAYSSGESITFGQLALDEDRFDSIADTTQYAYEQILGFLATHEIPGCGKSGTTYPESTAATAIWNATGNFALAGLRRLVTTRLHDRQCPPRRPLGHPFRVMYYRCISSVAPGLACMLKTRARLNRPTTRSNTANKVHYSPAAQSLPTTAISNF
jgi:hypothetical protein